MQIGELGEFALIRQLSVQIGERGAGIRLGVGDDTAVLTPTPGTELLATCDSQIDGHHFRREQIGPEQLGRRLAAVNLSDIASMGGRPRWALVSLVLPPATEVSYVSAVYDGLIAELSRYGASIVGGNIAAGERLMLDLTLLGEIDAGRALRRDGARAGDDILVSGVLGASATGRAILERGTRSPITEGLVAIHQTPTARIEAGQAIAMSGVATAMLDISDGLAQDLGHICDASGVGAVVEASSLPLQPQAVEVAADLGLDALELALHGGEDYELLCTVAHASSDALIAKVQSATGASLTRIGSILQASDGRWLDRGATGREPLERRGWEHF